MSPEFDKRIPAALLILRFFLAIFLLQWSIEKLILPDAAARITRSFYGVTLPVEGLYTLGIAELIVSLALLVGFYRTISYGLSLLIHTVTVAVSWRQLFDPWGLAKVGSHLWISTWPTWGGFAALFLMREWDTWTSSHRYVGMRVTGCKAQLNLAAWADAFGKCVLEATLPNVPIRIGKRSQDSGAGT